MKRGISLMLVLFILTSVLSGCGDQADNTQRSSTPGAQAKPEDDVKIFVTPQLIGNENAEIEITWQPVPAHSMSDSNQKKVEYLKGKATEWAEKHPEAKIKVADTSVNINDAMAKTLVQLASGDAVDMSAIDSFIFPNFSRYSQPLDDVMEEYNLDINDWFPYAQKTMKPADKVLGFWYTTDVRVLYYRKDLVPNPPKTWDEVFETGEEMKGKGIDTLLYCAGRDEATTHNSLPYFWGQGGKLVDESGKAVFGEGENREYLINTLAFFKKTVDTGITPQRVLNFKTDPDMITDLASGKVAMFVGNSNMASQLRSAIGEEEFDKLWDVAQIPMSKEGQRMSAAGGWISTVFTNDDQKRKLGADFLINMYVDDEGMEGWCTAGGYVPVRKSVFDKAKVFSDDPISMKFKQELEFANVRPASDLYSAISQEIQIAISKVLTGEATPEEAVESAWQTIQNKQ